MQLPLILKACKSSLIIIPHLLCRLYIISQLAFISIKRMNISPLLTLCILILKSALKQLQSFINHSFIDIKASRGARALTHIFLLVDLHIVTIVYPPELGNLRALSIVD
jgi:hypothetical protein